MARKKKAPPPPVADDDDAQQETVAAFVLAKRIDAMLVGNTLTVVGMALATVFAKLVIASNVDNREGLLGAFNGHVVDLVDEWKQTPPTSTTLN